MSIAARHSLLWLGLLAAFAPTSAWGYAKTYDLYDAPVLYQKGASAYGWTRKVHSPLDRTLLGIKTGAESSVKAAAPAGQAQNWTYLWDGLGNLTQRANSVQNGSSSGETFRYDSLNRLTTRDGAAIATYDPNGNMIGRRVSDGVSGTIWTAAWTAFDKPKFIARQGVGSSFHYDADDRRAVQIEFDNLSGGVGRHADKKLYAGAQMEIDYKNAIPSGPTPSWQLDRVRVYVDGPDGRTGAREWKASTGAAERLVYHHDHLGSVDAISLHGAATAALAPDRNSKSSLFSYDPWGERRDPADWLGKPSATSGGDPKALLSPRGYTDHEMLDEIGLVHMNGRIYDPLLGRFLSADKVVQFPEDLQSYNRYSYVSNNPLSNTDPTGYEKKSARLLKLIKAKRNTLNNLESRISNVEQRIQTRIGQHKENPLDLPEDAGPNAKPSEDRVKHRRLINEDKALVADLKGQLSVAKNEIVQLGKNFAVARAAEKAAAAAEKASAKAAGKKIPLVKVLMLGVIVPELIDEVEARIEEDDVGGAIREVVGQLEPTGLAEEGPNIMENVGDIVGTLGDLVGIDLGPNPFDREDASSDTDEASVDIVLEDVLDEEDEEDE